MGGNNEFFFENFERNKYLKKLPSMQRVKLSNCILNNLSAGYPPKTGTATMRIPVGDVNDNAPDFVLPHPPVVMEDEPPNQLVVTFSATDRDTPQYGPPFHFALPPCEQNPTCRNGVQDFIMTFNPCKYTTTLQAV